MTPEVAATIIVGLGVPMLGYTGALVYFAGSVRQALSDHNRRIESLERERELAFARPVEHVR